MKATMMMLLWMPLLWALSVHSSKHEHQINNMEFYIHTKGSAPNQTAIVVAGQNGDRVTVQFGTVSVGDLLLTELQSNTSKQVGRLKIMVLNADSNVAVAHAHEFMSVVIETKQYNGTFAINGRDIVNGSELAIVGGTGDFRGVKGWANFTHVEINFPDSVTHVNATLLYPPSFLYYN